MKKIVYISSLFVGIIALSLGSFVACDRLDEDEYIKSIEEKKWNGQTIILEDYTGHKCINCPKAAEITERLKRFYKDKIIVVATHVTPQFASPDESHPQDFRTEEGTAWNGFFKISPEGLPAGMINRENIEGKKRTQYTQWTNLVGEKIYETPILKLEMTSSYNAATRQATINATATFLQDITSDLRIGLMLLQDGIVGPQANGSETIENFTFNHVLRQTIGGTWGEEFIKSTDGIKAGATKLYTKTFTVAESLPLTTSTSYNSKTPVIPENCHVVLYVSTGGTPSSETDANYKFVQGIEKPLVNNGKK